jgi:hypothetical protein
MKPALQENPESLIALLSQQRDRYLELRALSELQRVLIAEGRSEPLLGLLRDRQQVVSALSRLNEELGPYRRDWENTIHGLSETHRRQATSLLQETNDLLRVILRTDQEDSALLAARKQAAARELSQVGGGQTANSAYAAQNPATTAAISADLKG